MNKSKMLDSYIESGSSSVEGWGINHELIKIIRALSDKQKNEGITGGVAEIGVHHGKTLIFLGLLTSDGELAIGIDLFESGQAQNLDFSGSGSYSRLVENIKIHACLDYFKLIQANSFFLNNDTLMHLENIRIFHIDGGHFLEAAMNDLSVAQNAIGLGGIIIIDDYLHSGFPEVQEAVHKYFWNSTKIKAIPFAIGQNKLFLAEASYKEKFMDWLKNNNTDYELKKVKVLGYDAICLDRH